MDNDYFTVKNILLALIAPITYLLGWHYKNLSNKIEKSDISLSKLKINSNKHSIRIDYLEDTVNRLDHKMSDVLDTLDQKVDEVLKKLEKL
jgi:hypothetical protein